MEASAGVIHRAFAFTSSAVAHSTRNDNGPAVFDHACQSGIEAIVSKRLDPQCRLDRQRFGSKIRAKPCAVRKTGIRERLRYCWRSGRGRMPGGIASKAKGRPCQRLRLWARAGVGLWSPLLRNDKAMPSTKVTGGFKQKVNSSKPRRGRLRFALAPTLPGDLLALPLRPLVSRCDRFCRPGKSSGPPPFAPSLNVQGDDAHNNSGFSVI
jgi:hypothetical protein